MMSEWVECVPNFSEGRNEGAIRAICDAVESVPGTRLLHVDIGYDANRTVVTYAARPGDAVEAGFRAVSEAARRIDMSRHRGAHPRIGATDVFPFIPLKNVTFDACISLAEALGRRVASELGIPVYLYGKAARTAERAMIPLIRSGQYEALLNRIQQPRYKPDFGPSKLPPRSGATLVGVRDFLIAYNVNLDSDSVALAKEIAAEVRESGRLIRSADGRVQRDEQGRAMRIPGRLKKCQATGWFMKAYGMAQVTMNLLDFKTTGIHTAFEAVRYEAERRGCAVRGSEIVGLVPEAALSEAGGFYRDRSRDRWRASDDPLQIGVQELGLGTVRPFDVEARVIERILTL